MVESNGPTTVAALWAMTGITLLFIVLRLYCKGVYTRQLRVDDAILLLAWTLTLIYSALVTVAVKFGLGKHTKDIDRNNFVSMYKFMFMSELFTLVAIPLSKTSFALTLLRLVTQTWHKVFIWFILITMNIAMWLCAILLFVQCKPIAKNWDRKMEGSCWDGAVQDRYSIFAGSYSAFLDFVLAMFPWLIIRKLQINSNEKIGIIVCMSLGCLAGITAVVKTSFLPGTGNFTDMPFQITDLLIWSNAESAVTILAASIPFFRVLIRNRVSNRSTPAYRQSYRLGSFGKDVSVGRTSRLKGSRSIDITSNDNMSEQSILNDLPIQGTTGIGVIMKKEEIKVEYSSSQSV